MLLTIIMWLTGSWYLSKLRKRIDELETQVLVLSIRRDKKDEQDS